MNNNVKEFIEKHIELIEDNRWDELYETANQYLSCKDIGYFTETMFAADIHPEEYLKNLPPYFLTSANIKHFTIPNHVTKIYPYAFFNCSSLTNVSFGENSQLTSIGGDVFWECTSLTSIIIPDSVTSIGGMVFYGCEKLKKIVIPDTITSISEKMFYGCTNLNSVKISKYVNNISEHAFSYCGDNLTISYSGTKADWKKIYNPKAFQDTYFIVNCIDGKIIKRKR